MWIVRLIACLAACVLCLGFAQTAVRGDEPAPGPARIEGHFPPEPDFSPIPEPEVAPVTVEAVVVNPYRTANVGAQVGGVIDRFNFEEGDFVREGQVVAEVFPRRYILLVQRARERLKALEAALQRAREEARIKTELFDLDSTTRQELVKFQTEAEIGAIRVEEARKELDLALFDLDACKIKAPFSGYLAIRHKQPDESVERNEKVFLLVDSSKIHAVGNVPEALLDRFPKGTEAFFQREGGPAFKGVVDRIGKLIDPKSRTKRVYVVIDNSRNQLEVGMTGTLRLAESLSP